MNPIFKKTALCLMIAATISACGSSGDGGEENQDALTGSISRVGDVDWFEHQVTSSNEVVEISVTSNVLRSDVELLATAYEKDEDGNLVRLYAEHAGVNSATAANLNLNLLIKEPKTIYLSVRDLKDDAADGFDYKVSFNVSNTVDDTSSFEDALSLNQSCQEDVIGAPGDIDAFSYTVSERGVYSFLTDFQKTAESNVFLGINLYKEDGTLVESLAEPSSKGTLYSMVHFLEPGTYYAMLAHDGRNGIRFDPASPYSLCANQLESDELAANDTKEDAEDIQVTIEGTIIEGALDYNKDEDWYELALPAKGDGDFQVLEINFDAGSALGYYQYEITVVDANGNAVMTHIQNSESNAYNSQLKVEADNAPYYLVITPLGDQVYTSSNADDDSYVSSAPYTASVSAIEVDDAGDVVSNDSQQSATELVSGADWTMAKIAYRTDNDWYSISVENNGKPQILEVYLETEDSVNGGAVEYSLAIVGSQVVRTLEDMVGADGPTVLKSSIMVAANTADTESVYFFRVRDFQDDDSDSQSGYRIKARSFDIPSDFLTTVDQPAGAVYHDEKAELADDSALNEIALKVEDVNNTWVNEQGETEEIINFERKYITDPSTLVFDGADKNPAFVRVDSEDGLTSTFTSPWIGGYIDYQGDQDWFKLNLQALEATAYQLDDEGNPVLDEDDNPVFVDQDSNWYYDLKVEMLSAGSSVEYVWKLYYDTSKNGYGSVTDFSSTTGDGVAASNGDTSKEIEAVNLVTGGSSGEFWRNEQLKGTYYLKVAEYNLINSAKDYIQYDDYDWSYDEPYYVRLTLTYHSGESRYVSE